MINSIDYSLVQEWNGGFKSELFFTPGKRVKGWRITLDADFEISNDSIWGAKIISHVGDRYILGPTNENRQYYPNYQNKITIVAQSSAGDSSNVDNLTFYNSASEVSSTPNPTPTSAPNPTPNNSGEADFDYDLIKEWNGGFKSELFFTPEERVKDWRITLDADFEMSNDSMWGAKIINRDGDRYTLAPTDENRQYSANYANKITIVAQATASDSPLVDNLVFYNSASEISPTPTPNPTPNPTPVTNPTPDPTNYGNGQFRYGEAIQKSFLFYEAQRSGELPDDNRVEWRGDSALNDGSDVGRDLTGGYYDAGDHIKFGMPMALSMTTLAWGGIEYKTAYKEMNQFDELLDAVKWGTDWILKAHVKENGQTKEVYVQVGDGKLDHSVWAPAETMTMARPSLKIDANNPGTDVAADYAASLASASMLFKGENNGYANRLLREAKQLYSFAETNLGKYSDSVPGVNPYYTSYSGYGDELMWGANWLYKATGEKKYFDKAIKYGEQYGLNPGSGTLSWDDKRAGSLIMLAQTKDNLHETGNNPYEKIAANWLDSWLPGGNSATYTDGGFAWRSKWGSLRTTANTAFLAGVYHDTVDSKPRYHDFATEQIDYVLGDNPRNSSYVVGFGDNSPERAHHRSAAGFDNNTFGSSEPNDHIIYGALVGGIKSANDFDWQDDRTDAVGNEIALDYNSGYTGALAYLYDKYGGDPLTDNELDALVGVDVAGI